ncbi:serine/threonine-protein kinase [Nonomuraea sp. NEAU-A123]|uniref:serine/threonine protein kinase n=1 Tax=Nonomuraea sp. NEAU-A123 TaxID=2839649 RepID=UPI001BE46BA3|nr:serine/threonine-protein kinase [Nonomuraea sp. NEAU-A123]MBT2228772.1 protein kinase [Nonomuraea sp. NEAU-A123]
MSDATPSLIAGRYRLDELIGSGPTGEVWRGYDQRADWTVAVKMLDTRAATPEVLRQHAQAVARVIHPNVAMVLDVGDHEGAPFLVMEFLTGESLGEEVAGQGPLPIVEACDLIGQAAAGLEAAHRAGVVHGQIGPDSFRRAGSGVLKVVGFGLADQVPSDDGVRYRAPEVIDGRGGEAPADLYALGCVCYEVLCGRPPFDGSPEEVGERHLHAEPAPPSSHRAEVPGELDRLVLAMLAKDPAARPAGGEPVRRALAAIARPPRPQPGGQSTAPQSHPATGPQATPHPAPQSGQATPYPGGAPQTGQAMSYPGGAPQPGQPIAHLSGAGIGDTQAMPPAVFHDGGGPRKGDTAIYDAPPPGPPPNRRLFVQLGVALVAIAAVTVGLILWSGSRGEPVAGPTPSPTPTTSAPAPEPTETPEPSTSVAPLPTDPVGPTPAPKGTLGNSVPSGGWAHWLGEFDAAVTSQETIGDIEPGVARKAHEKIRKAGRKLLENHDGPAFNQIADVMRDLRKAQAKGDVPSSGPLAEFLDDWKP